MKDVCSQCRKHGTKLFLKGVRCTTPKCALTRRNYKPGSHGAKGTNRRKSEYGLQLLEKQKAKAEYGLREAQFSKIFHVASRSRQATGEALLRLLEERFDNIVYRLGWAVSRPQARQFVSHGYFKINDKIANIPSMTLRPNDKISIRKSIEPNKVTVPKWLKMDVNKKNAEVAREPLREEIETDLDEQLIIEFYSR